MEAAGAYQQVGGGLRAAVVLVYKGQVSSHGLTDRKKAGAGGIDPYVFNEHLRVGKDHPGGGKVHGGGDITWDGDPVPVKLRRLADRGGGALGADIRAKEFQHQLRMVPGDLGLCDTGLPFGIKARQENG